MNGKCFVSLRRYMNVNVVGNVLGAEKWGWVMVGKRNKDLES
jgi:hypothetical protein